MLPIIYPNGEPEIGKKYIFIKTSIPKSEFDKFNNNQMSDIESPEDIKVTPSEIEITKIEKQPTSSRIAILRAWRKNPEEDLFDIMKPEKIVSEGVLGDIGQAAGEAISAGAGLTAKKLKQGYTGYRRNRMFKDVRKFSDTGDVDQLKDIRALIDSRIKRKKADETDEFDDL